MISKSLPSQSDGLADDVRVLTEGALPQTMCEHGYLAGIGSIVPCVKDPSERRGRAQHAQV